ncbi:MAG: 50S ribosomal protein L25/general stress protein Ctc [Bacteroidales bacterium]|nr:50S ribosomal protein L25/general stress protein Ctc [Bacteroidales bacterium]
MKTFELSGEIREVLGKKTAKDARKAEMVPCVLYGGKENVHFTVTQNNVRKLIYTPEVFIVDLSVGDFKTKAVVKELQFHPVTDKLMHIDFLEVSADKPIIMQIPVTLKGLAAGVKDGGKLGLRLRKLQVKGIYNELPENIVLDVTKLKLGDSIQVGDLSFDNFELLNPKNSVIVQVKLIRDVIEEDVGEDLDEEDEDALAGEVTEATSEEEEKSADDASEKQ